MQILVYILSAFSIITILLSAILKNKTTIMFLYVLDDIWLIGVYLLLGKYLGMVLVGILTIKTLVFFLFSLKKIKPNIWMLILFEALIIGASIFLWQNWFDIFMLVNSILMTYATWQDNVKVLKIACIVRCCLLMTYNTLVRAYLYVVSNFIEGVSSTICLIDIFKKEKISKSQVTKDSKDK